MKWTLQLYLLLFIGSSLSNTLKKEEIECYITDWTSLKRYYIKKGSFMEKHTYNFSENPDPQTQKRGDRKFSFSVCSPNLAVPDITDKKKFSWKVYTTESDDNIWQAGQFSQLYGNMTLSIIAMNEEFIFLNIIPEKVKPEVLEKSQGRFEIINDSHINFHLYTDQLESRTIYFEDSSLFKFATGIFGLIIAFIGLSFNLESKYLGLPMLKWLINSLAFAWSINIYILVTFPENNQLAMAILVGGSAFLGAIFMFSSSLSDFCFYLMFILSCIDLILYISFMNFMVMISGILAIIYIFLNRGKHLKTADLIKEWMASWLIAIQASIYFSHVFYFNSSLGGLYQISQGVYLSNIHCSLYALFFFAVLSIICTLRFVLSKNRLEFKVGDDEIDYQPISEEQQDLLEDALPLDRYSKME